MSECEVTKVNAPKLDANPQLVVLTIEEAKEVLEYLNGYYFPMELRDIIQERIEAVEKLNEAQ